MYTYIQARTDMANQSQQYTTIAVSPETRERLRARKRGGASYEDVILSLMDARDESTD